MRAGFDLTGIAVTAVNSLHWIEAQTLFEEVAALRYPFGIVYSAEDYLAILATQSGTRALGEARSAEFLRLVRDRLRSLGTAQLAAAFVGLLTIGRRTTSCQNNPFEGSISKHDFRTC